MTHFGSRLRMLRLLLSIALVQGMASSPAAAGDIFKKVKKAVKKGADTVSHEVTKTAHDATSEVHALDAEAAKTVTSTAKKSYESTLKAGESAYQKTAAEVKSGIDAAKKAALTAAGKAYLKKYKGFLGKFRSKLDALAKDDAAVVVLERLVKAASEKRLDDNVRADLAVIGEKLGMLEWKAGSIVPGASGGDFKSSWGIAVGGGGAYVAGVEGSVGLVANCYKEKDQRYGAGLAISVGGVVGMAIGGSADVTFFWQPGGVSDAEGGYVGLGFEAAYAEIGGTIGLQWSVYEGMKGATAGIPGFYLGWAGGVEEKAGALEGGYTFVPVKSVK